MNPRQLSRVQSFPRRVMDAYARRISMDDLCRSSVNRVRAFSGAKVDEQAANMDKQPKCGKEEDDVDEAH